MLLAMVMVMTPTVAAVPKAVPVSEETRQHNKKAASSIPRGVHRAVA